MSNATPEIVMVDDSSSDEDDDNNHNKKPRAMTATTTTTIASPSRKSPRLHHAPPSAGIIDPVGVAPNAATTTTATTCSAPSLEVIDLCQCTDEKKRPARRRTGTLSHQPEQATRGTGTSTQPHQAVVIVPPHVDVIDIDADGRGAGGKQQTLNSTTLDADPATWYRQTLGPLRFDFVEGGRTGNNRCGRRRGESVGNVTPTDAFLQHHAFADSKQNPSLPTSKIYKELLEYKLNLPIDLSSSIFCRVSESRVDLIRALITGPEGTPYQNGCFFFDIQLTDYPKRPPVVKFLTTGGGRARFNPNLYNCGKVCLSLLGTWSGPGWQANKSTLLQVLISIQGLILVPDPYYNEPGFKRRDPHHATQAENYNRNIRSYTLRYAMNDFLEQIVQHYEATHRLSTTVAATATFTAPPEATRQSSRSHLAASQPTTPKGRSKKRRKAATPPLPSAVPDWIAAASMPPLSMTDQNQHPPHQIPPQHPQKALFPGLPNPPCTYATSYTDNNNVREDYPEFTRIMIQHFCQRADSIREQLDAWLTLDATLAPCVIQVRRNLDRVVAWYGTTSTTTKPNNGDVAVAAAAAAAAAGAAESSGAAVDLIWID